MTDIPKTQQVTQRSLSDISPYSMGKLAPLPPHRLRMTPSLSIPRTLGWPNLPSSPSDSVPSWRSRCDGRIACGVIIKAVCLSCRIMELQSAGPCCSFWMVWYSAGGWACVKTAFLTTQAPVAFSTHLARSYRTSLTALEGYEHFYISPSSYNGIGR